VNGITVGRGGGNESTNTAIGINTLSSSASSAITGSDNTAYGYRTLRSNTTGNFNTASGSSALMGNTVGNNNTAIGNIALEKNTIGSNNTASGSGALGISTTGTDNTAVGYYPLASNTTGSRNTAYGSEALAYNIDGTNNTAIGYRAGVSFITNNLSNTTAIGNGAAVVASNTIQLGNRSVTDVKTSGAITAGDVTYPKTHGTNGQVLTTTGSGTLSWTSIANPDLTNYVTTNTAQTITSAKTFSETTTFSKDLRVNGIKVGIGGGNNVSNTVFGNEAFYSNLTGISNTVIGNNALFYSTGSNNTATGSGALFYNTGSNNTASGWRALLYNTTGSNNTAIGYNAGVADGNGTISNATAIGSGAIVAADNTIQLGNTSVTNVNTSGTITAAGIGLGVSAPNASAILEASSTTQGFLPPRLSTTQRDAIATPAEGLTLWNTDNKQLEVFDGSYWKNMVGLLVSPLNIGDTYGGGKVFYIFGPSDNGYIKGQTHGLIAATVDQTTDAGVKWFPDKFYGATGTYIGLGLPNTLAIITSAVVTGTTNMSTFAAGLANSYRGGGYIDWFLPSKDELNLLYQVKDVIGGFATSGHPTYWSSTQKGGINLKDFASFVKGVESARTQFFFTTTGPDGKAAGTQSDLGIDNPRRVRAIRVF
jgi:hypothetical protein